jgi:hypothetical protein
LTLFPNPLIGDHLTIVLNEKLSGIVHISIFDVNGKSYFSQSKEIKDHKIVIDSPMLPAGTYILCLENGQQKISETLLIR